MYVYLEVRKTATNAYEVDEEYCSRRDPVTRWENHDSWPEFNTAMSVYEPLIVDMAAEYTLTWISEYDLTRVWDAATDSVQAMVDQRNSRSEGNDFGSEIEITFPSERMAVLWMAEIRGQISDGVWEGELRGSQWKSLVYAQMEIDESADSVDISGSPTSLDLSHHLTRDEELVARQIFYVRASGADPDYDEGDLKDDLDDLTDELKSDRTTPDIGWS